MAVDSASVSKSSTQPRKKPSKPTSPRAEAEPSMTVSQGNPSITVQPRGFPALPEGWFTEWETLPSADETVRLFTITHRKRGANSGRAVVVVHGMGEHSGRYLHVPHYLAD